MLQGHSRECINSWIWWFRENLKWFKNLQGNAVINQAQGRTKSRIELPSWKLYCQNSSIHTSKGKVALEPGLWAAVRPPLRESWGQLSVKQHILLFLGSLHWNQSSFHAQLCCISPVQVGSRGPCGHEQGEAWPGLAGTVRGSGASAAETLGNPLDVPLDTVGLWGPGPKRAWACEGWGLQGLRPVRARATHRGSATMVAADMEQQGWSSPTQLALLCSAGNARGMRAQARSFATGNFTSSFPQPQSLLYPEAYPNQLPKYRLGKIVPHGLIRLRLNRADNLQIDRMKLAGNGWNQAKLSWYLSCFKHSSSAPCGWTTEMGRFRERKLPFCPQRQGQEPSSSVIFTQWRQTRR